MPSENVATVEAFFEFINRDEVDDALELLDPDTVLDFSRAISPDNKGVYKGRKEIRGQLERFTEAWEQVEYFADEYIELADVVIRVGGLRAKGQGSGVEVTAHGAWLCEFRDGKVVAARLCQSKEEALELAAAG